MSWAKATRYLAGGGIQCIKLFIWIFGIIILIALTINDIKPLWYDYQHNNVATQMQVVVGNNTLRTPPLTYCLPRYPLSLRRIAEHLSTGNESVNCTECDSLSANSWDVWSSQNFSSNLTANDYYYWLSGAITSLLLKIGVINDYHVLSSANSAWNQPLLEAVWDLFDCIADLDASVDFGPHDQSGWYSLCYGRHDVNLALSGKNADKLFDYLLETICDFLVVSTNGESCQKALRASKPVIYSNAICFAVPFMDNGSYIWFNVINGKNGNWPGVAYANISFALCSDTSMLNWPLTSLKNSDTVYRSDTLSANVLTAEERGYIKYLITMTVSEQFDDNDCYDDQTPTSCFGKCVVRNTMNSCNCTPFTFRADSSSIDSPYCNVSAYANCDVNKTEIKAVCGQKCGKPCEYVAYQWHVSRDLIPRSNRRVLSLTIAPIIAPYVEFTVSTKDSSEQFFSQLAAVFNLYIGLSGLSVIWFIIFCIDLLAKWWHLRKNKKSRVERIFTWSTNSPVCDENSRGNRSYPIQTRTDTLSATVESIKLADEVADLRKRLQNTDETQKLIALSLSDLEKQIEKLHAIIERKF